MDEDGIPRFDWNKVIQGKLLGQGAEAAVYKVEYQGQMFAMKSIFCSVLTEESLEPTMEEVNLSWQLRHHSTVRFDGFFIHIPHVCLMYEYCPLGDLAHLLQNVKKGSRPEGLPHPCHFADGCTAGIEFLQSFHTPVVHRDVKPDNFLITSDWQVKLADFGESRICESDGEVMDVVGSPGYMAPEVLSGSHGEAEYDCRVDIFSLGMVAL